MTVFDTLSIDKMKHRNQQETVWIKKRRKTWSLQWLNLDQLPLWLPSKPLSLLSILFPQYSFLQPKTLYNQNQQKTPLPSCYVSLLQIFFLKNISRKLSLLVNIPPTGVTLQWPRNILLTVLSKDPAGSKNQGLQLH